MALFQSHDPRLLIVLLFLLGIPVALDSSIFCCVVLFSQGLRHLFPRRAVVGQIPLVRVFVLHQEAPTIAGDLLDHILGDGCFLCQ